MNYCQFRNDVIKRMAVTSGGGILPAEYQQVEYLQSNNSNSSNSGADYIHINTGIYYFANFELECHNTENISNVTCGCGDNSYGATLGRLSFSQPYFTFFVTKQNYYITNKTITTKSRLAWIDNNIYVDGVIVAQKNRPTSTKEFKLYGYISDAPYYYKSVRIYYCKLWDYNGDLVRYYIPCFKKSDNTPGMYDIVTKTFNAGTGSSGYFTVGNNV